MDKIEARVVNVIQTTCGDTITYHTLEGIMIGSFIGGKVVEAPPVKLPAPKPKGGVVTAVPPKEVRRQKQKEVDRELSLEERLGHEKEFNT